MRIAFLSEHPCEVGAFSGIPYHMSAAIRESCEYFVYIQVPSYDYATVMRGGEQGLRELQRIGQFATECLRDLTVDLVVCQGASMLPFLETDKFVVHWHDAMWLGLLQLEFDEFRLRYPLLYEWDRRVLENSDLVAYAADWVRDLAIAHYQIAPGKVHVVPFGANVQPLTRQTVTRTIEERRRDLCRLAFLGIDWVRKGLPLAYEVLTRLNVSGVPAELSVVGCEIPKVSLRSTLRHYSGYRRFNSIERFRYDFHRDKKIHNIGFVAKDDPKQYQELSRVLCATHFLLHPASFECFGIALAEANAFGVPVIATDQYGPKTIVRTGINGALYPPSEYAARTAAFIEDCMNNYDAYNTLAMGAFDEYEGRLNWLSGFERICELIPGSTLFS